MFPYGAIFILKYMVQCYCTSNKGCFTAFHDLPANALLFIRVLCNVLHTNIVIQKINVQFWDDAFLAVVGIKIHHDYTFMSTCVNTTQQSPILILFATNICPLHLVNRLALNSVVLGQPLASQLGRSRSGVTTSCYNSVYGVPSGD